MKNCETNYRIVHKVLLSTEEQPNEYEEAEHKNLKYSQIRKITIMKITGIITSPTQNSGLRERIME